MSRIGKQLIKLPDSVKADVLGRVVKISGPKGELEKKLVREVEVKVENGEIAVLVKGKSKFAKSIHGTTRAIIANMVEGVENGWTKKLELVGTGYRAEVSGKKLTLVVGFSHPVEIEIPEKINASVDKNLITLEGIDKEDVGRIAAKIRSIRPPEPYKGKGIKYEDEVVRRKPGKAAKGPGAAA